MQTEAEYTHDFPDTDPDHARHLQCQRPDALAPALTARREGLMNDFGWLIPYRWFFKNKPSDKRQGVSGQEREQRRADRKRQRQARRRSP